MSMNHEDRSALERLAPLTDPARVRRAREGLRLTQGELASLIRQRAGHRVSAPALSQIERGQTRPSADTLGALATALDYPVEFFVRRGSDDEVVDGFFRSLRSTPVRDRKAAMAQVHLVHDFVLEVERRLRLPDVDVPCIPLDASSTDLDAAEAARAVRERWGIPDGPIVDVVRELERHGIVVVRLSTGTRKVDAFSVAFRDRPLVILGDDKGKRGRSRFDASHELAHVVGHRDVKGWERRAEEQANAFAAEFLLPEADITPELRAAKLTWGRLLELKLRWGVSLQALLYRAKSLGVLSQPQYVNWIKGLSARGWRIDEPGDAELGPPERSSLLELAVAHLEEAGTALPELVAAAGLPTKEVQSILQASVDARPRLEI